MKYRAEYQTVKDFYGLQVQKRSQVPLINHIDEGIKILNYLNASSDTIGAFCLHPLIQNTPNFKKFLAKVKCWYSPNAMMLAVEYRNIANQYLPTDYANEKWVAPISDIPEINQMLIADKVQNRKDFERHRKLYSNHQILDGYFKVWLSSLKIFEDDYQRIIKKL